jgi:Ca2+/H+ antiporter, TMEM165/GDT1 family
MMTWTVVAPAISAAFLSSLVEAVEALTIVLAVGTVRGWRPAGLGALVGLVLLALIVLALGPLLDRVPLRPLQLAIGVLLLLFGMRWLRKAILRAAGVIPLHDETIAYAAEMAQLREQERDHKPQLDWFAALASFKAVVIEGLEVVFIVIAVGAGRGLIIPASIGAIAACILVTAVGFVVHRPLARVPENTLKFTVGVMLSAFGVFWIGEGLGVPWPGEDIAIIAFAAAVPPCRACGGRPHASPRHRGITMSALISLFGQLVGLFVDDGWLALATLCIVALASLIAFLMPSLSLPAGAILLFGCLGALLANVLRAAQRRDVP